MHVMTFQHKDFYSHKVIIGKSFSAGNIYFLVQKNLMFSLTGTNFYLVFRHIHW